MKLLISLAVLALAVNANAYVAAPSGWEYKGPATGCETRVFVGTGVGIQQCMQACLNSKNCGGIFGAFEPGYDQSCWWCSATGFTQLSKPVEYQRLYTCTGAFCVQEPDCLGVRGGNAVRDDCGVCNGGNANKDDCGVCNGGNAAKDECGVCNGDGSSCDEGKFTFLFNGCPRGAGAATWANKGNMPRSDCEKSCAANAECNAIEVNGCNTDVACNGACYHFYGSGDIYNGQCRTNGDMKAYLKPTPSPEPSGIWGGATYDWSANGDLLGWELSGDMSIPWGFWPVLLGVGPAGTNLDGNERDHAHGAQVFTSPTWCGVASVAFNVQGGVSLPNTVSQKYKDQPFNPDSGYLGVVLVNDATGEVVKEYTQVTNTHNWIRHTWWDVSSGPDCFHIEMRDEKSNTGWAGLWLQDVLVTPNSFTSQP